MKPTHLSIMIFGLAVCLKWESASRPFQRGNKEQAALVGAFFVIVKSSANIRLKLYLLDCTDDVAPGGGGVTCHAHARHGTAPATTRPFLTEAEYDRSNNKLLFLCHTQPLDTSTHQSRVSRCEPISAAALI